jgi:CubicO group peptidase (beta-lactamase class C family)
VGRAIVLLGATLALSATSCIYARIFYFNIPTLAAPTYFDEREVHAKSPRPLPRAEHEATFALTEEQREKYATFDELLEANDTRAFLALRDDRVVYERYFDNVTAETRLPGFSISKTLAALLVGCAADDGLLSTKQSVVTYIPELSQRDGYPDVTLDHLLRMVSGIDFDEESTAGAVLYYSTDLRSHLYSYDVKWRPGTHYLYGSINTQLLWDVLQRRLKGRTVADYFETRIWQRLGAEHDATWSLDSLEGSTEKLFGGFNATARDHARLGMLYLHGGKLDGQTVVSPEWVARSISPDPVPGTVHTTDGFLRRGHYQWFLTLDGKAFFAKGYHGQYVFVVPERNMVFVRFGEGYGDVDWLALFERLARAG